jgi:hypothetical protein
VKQGEARMSKHKQSKNNDYKTEELRSLDYEREIKSFDPLESQEKQNGALQNMIIFR